MATIELDRVSFTYSGTASPAISDVHLKISKGEFILFTGPSGCGKTTLCRCINGLIPHFYAGKLEGDVRVVGLNVKEHEVSELSTHVGFVFQNPDNQLFTLVVEKDIAFGLENLALPRKEIRKRINWALRMTGTDKLRDRSPYELSGGEKQRVVIASVLAMRPKVLILDEPTSFVDPLTAKKIIEVVYNLNKKLSMSVILVEHRISLFAGYADRAIVMDEGRIVLDGPPEEVLSSKRARKMGVEIPVPLRLYQSLGDEGIRLPKAPLTASAIASELRKVLK